MGDNGDISPLTFMLTLPQPGGGTDYAHHACTHKIVKISTGHGTKLEKVDKFTQFFCLTITLSL